MKYAFLQWPTASKPLYVQSSFKKAVLIICPCIFRICAPKAEKKKILCRHQNLINPYTPFLETLYVNLCNPLEGQATFSKQHRAKHNMD